MIKKLTEKNKITSINGSLKVVFASAHRIKTKAPLYMRFNIVTALLFCQTHKATVALSMLSIAAVLVILMIHSTALAVTFITNGSLKVVFASAHRIKTKAPLYMRFNIVTALLFCQTHKATVALSMLSIAAVLVILMIHSEK